MIIKTIKVECLVPLVVLQVLLFHDAYGRECYNYKEDPRVRQCSNGCCGEDYAEYCCDATMQIMGSVLGGLVVIGIVIAVAVYCYTRKSKRRQMASGGGILGHLGARRNNQAAQQPRTGPPQVPRNGRVFRIPSQNRDPPAFAGGAYYNSNNQQVSMAPPGSFNYDQSGMQYPPTAPMPPPYAATAPPPYSALKESPPDYQSVASIGHMGGINGHKPGEYTDGMTPPAY